MKIDINLTVSILDKEIIVSDRGTSQTEYRIKMKRGISNVFTVSYVDSGNNAEYESHLDTISQGAYYLLNFNDTFKDALHEYLDFNAYDLKIGAFLVFNAEKCEFKALSGAFLIFSPIDIILSVKDILKTVKNSLKEGQVTFVSKSYSSKFLEWKQVDFRGPKANAYGYDLYLYHIDTDQNETYLDCGGFN